MSPVLIVLVVGLVACASDDTFLPALLADPMADYEGAGIVLMAASEQEEGRNLVMDKPTSAHVRRNYRIVDQSRAEQVLLAAIEYAESQGWRFNKPDPMALGFGGAKTLEPGDARLGLSLIPEDSLNDPDGPLMLRIFFDFGHVRFDDVTTSTGSGGG